MFWFILGAGIMTGHFWEVVTVFFIVLVHELGHAAAALFFKWRVTEIVLLPFGGVAKVEEFGNKTLKEELIVTLAGPFQHLWLPLLSWILVMTNFWNEANHIMFMEKNVMILLFNLIPVWPLDGGKVLHIIFSKLWPFKVAYRRTMMASLVLMAILMIIMYTFHMFTLNFMLIMTFIGFVILKEWRQMNYVFMRFLLDRWESGQQQTSKVKRIKVKPEATMHQVCEGFYRGVRHSVMIADPRSQQSLDDVLVLEAYFRRHPQCTIQELLS